MSNSLYEVTALRALTCMFKMAEAFFFACRAEPGLNENVEKDARHRIIFELNDFLCCGGNVFEGADSYQGSASVGHYQMPHWKPLQKVER